MVLSRVGLKSNVAGPMQGDLFFFHPLNGECMADLFFGATKYIVSCTATQNRGYGFDCLGT